MIFAIIEWDMSLINKDGYVRKRTLTRYKKEYDGLRKILVRFSAPPDIRKTALLTWENKDADDTQFLYLPALKKTRRISTADKNQSFVGTDFNYEDMGNIKVNDFTYTDVSTEYIDGEACYFYECCARPDANTVYSRMRTWTSKKSMIRIRVEYFDEKGKFFKIGIAKNIEKINDIWTPLYVSMENLVDKHKTEVVVPKVVYDSGLPDMLFGTMNLAITSAEDI